MNYKVRHTTTYQYGDTAAVCQNVFHLTPRPVPWQNCQYHRLLVVPSPATMNRRIDYFGNPVTYVTVHDAHRKLTITSTSHIDVDRNPPAEGTPSPAWETVRDSLAQDTNRKGLDVYQFCFDSQLVARNAELGAYALESFTPDRPIFEAAADLTRRINADFVFDPKATSVTTPLLEVFAARRGVCQDMAHVQVGCLRSIGLAARYVSGYLRTIPPPGKERLVGADASHAWVGVYCGPLGWVDVDPTNNLVVANDHITVAWGRDYVDVCPIKGLFVGGGRHTMTVAADVEPLDEKDKEKE